MGITQSYKIFKALFSELNDFIFQINKEARKMGSIPLLQQTIKIVGQTALLLSDLPFTITATMDLDVVSKLDYKVQKKLNELLLVHGMQLETDGHLIWMPKDTSYKKVFEFTNLTVFIADAESVIASKFRFKRSKDQKLIQNYFDYFPDCKQTIKIKADK